MSKVLAAGPVLFLVGGGGFVWEAGSLLGGLPQSVDWVFVLPDDSVTPAWTRVGTVHKLPTFAQRSDRGFLGPALRFLHCALSAWRLVRRVRPRLVICMGSAMAVPVLVPAKMLGSTSVFIESITRTSELSRTGKLVNCLRLADLFLVQWPELADEQLGCRFEGTVL
ncbi:MAG: hypothetical protein IT515_13845 [Burkholderiales bacterium]|nr:hypothetical protein [Burkholderiales bacterium]